MILENNARNRWVEGKERGYKKSRFPWLPMKKE
jgi:hypothetical protein